MIHCSDDVLGTKTETDLDTKTLARVIYNRKRPDLAAVGGPVTCDRHRRLPKNTPAEWRLYLPF
jgi:hypothetical protein